MCAPGLTQHVVEDYKQVADVLEEGIANRITAATHVHDASSRSHAIFSIQYTQVLILHLFNISIALVSSLANPVSFVTSKTFCRNTDDTNGLLCCYSTEQWGSLIDYLCPITIT